MNIFAIELQTCSLSHHVSSRSHWNRSIRIIPFPNSTLIIRDPVCRDRHLYAYKTRVFRKRSRDSWGICQVLRLLAERLPKLPLSLGVYSRPPDKSPLAKRGSKRVTSRLPFRSSESFQCLPALLHLVRRRDQARVLGIFARRARENRIISPSLRRVLTLSFIIVLALRPPRPTFNPFCVFL